MKETEQSGTCHENLVELLKYHYIVLFEHLKNNVITAEYFLEIESKIKEIKIDETDDNIINNFSEQINNIIEKLFDDIVGQKAAEIKKKNETENSDKQQEIEFGGHFELGGGARKYRKRTIRKRPNRKISKKRFHRKQKRPSKKRYKRKRLSKKN